MLAIDEYTRYTEIDYVVESNKVFAEIVSVFSRKYFRIKHFLMFLTVVSGQDKQLGGKGYFLLIDLNFFLLSHLAW